MSILYLLYIDDMFMIRKCKYRYLKEIREIIISRDAIFFSLYIYILNSANPPNVYHDLQSFLHFKSKQPTVVYSESYQTLKMECFVKSQNAPF